MAGWSVVSRVIGLRLSANVTHPFGRFTGRRETSQAFSAGRRGARAWRTGLSLTAPTRTGPLVRRQGTPPRPQGPGVLTAVPRGLGRAAPTRGGGGGRNTRKRPQGWGAAPSPSWEGPSGQASQREGGAVSVLCRPSLQDRQAGSRLHRRVSQTHGEETPLAPQRQQGGRGCGTESHPLHPPPAPDWASRRLASPGDLGVGVRVTAAGLPSSGWLTAAGRTGHRCRVQRPPGRARQPPQRAAASSPGCPQATRLPTAAVRHSPARTLPCTWPPPPRGFRAEGGGQRRRTVCTP